MTITHPARTEVAWHESCHCASLLLDGHVPELVRIYRIASTDEGQTLLDWVNHQLDRDTAISVLTSLVMPLASEGKATIAIQFGWPIEVDAWPEGHQRDGEQARLVGEFAGITAIDWARIVHDAITRTRDMRFKRLASAISRQLETIEILFAHELAQIYRDTFDDLWPGRATGRPAPAAGC